MPGHNRSPGDAPADLRLAKPWRVLLCGMLGLAVVAAIGLQVAAWRSESSVEGRVERAVQALVEACARAKPSDLDGTVTFDPRVTQCTKRLVGYGPAAVPACIGLLGHEAFAVRFEAVLILRDIGDPRAVEPLLEIVRGGGMLGQTAGQALGGLGEPALQPLLDMLGDKRHSEWARGAAAMGLTALADKRAVPALFEVLSDESYYVRYHAAGALGAIGDPQAALPLAKIHDPRSLSPLVQALSDEDVCVRGHAADGLGHLKAPQAVPPLIGALADDDRWGMIRRHRP